MDPTLLIAIVALVAVALIAGILIGKRRTKALQSRFGPEYQHAVESAGSRAKAEAELHSRTERVSKFNIRPLPAGDRERFVGLWDRVQADFVDDPQGAATRADSLVGDVMSLRGYPVADFEQRSADLSVDHPVVAQNYRAGHDIALRHRRGEADTEELRQAMIHYRALFEELMRDGAAEPAQTAANGERR